MEHRRCLHHGDDAAIRFGTCAHRAPGAAWGREGVSGLARARGGKKREKLPEASNSTQKERRAYWAYGDRLKAACRVGARRSTGAREAQGRGGAAWAQEHTDERKDRV